MDQDKTKPDNAPTLLDQSAIGNSRDLVLDAQPRSTSDKRGSPDGGSAEPAQTTVLVTGCRLSVAKPALSASRSELILSADQHRDGAVRKYLDGLTAKQRRRQPPAAIA